MRRALDKLYDAAGYLAALFLVGTLVMVLMGIASRLLNFHVPGTDSYAGYCMAGCGFLALAHLAYISQSPEGRGLDPRRVMKIVECGVLHQHSLLGAEPRGEQEEENYGKKYGQ